jgi:outer membrane receptor protein involved in Fe transport
MTPRASRLFDRLAHASGLWLLCLVSFASAPVAQSQAPLHLHGHIHDASGRPASSATISATGPRGEITALSAADGSFQLDYPDLAPTPASTLTLRAYTPALQSDPIYISPQSVANDIDIVLHPTALTEQITVTATRSSIDLPATANTVYAIGTRQLNDYPATELDDKLRQQAGFELYRRSSSRVQNPTSQGISLRGLGSTAASRTLVLQNNVPMNDPFGGWLHWDEIPAEAVDGVTIATGGGSDLYGSSALGGVIDILPAHPSTGRFDLNALGGGQDTSSVGLRGDIGNARWSQLVAADAFRTAGYIPTAPTVAGPVDVPANVHSQSARTETDRAFTPSNRAFLIGNMLNEARGNGTTLTNNGTRLWRYIAADDWSAGPQASGRVRLFGSDEGYRQSFSSINSARTVETLTRLQRVRTQELGASTDASFALSPIALVLGADVRDIRASDDETPIASGAASGIADTSARQRFIGGFAEALASGHPGLFRNTSAALSLRLDSASNLDTQVFTQTLPQPVAFTLTPNRSEFIPSPRLGIVRRLPRNVAVHASVFRAFRTPTMNELYRTGQVGAQITQANSQLLSERATGWESGATFATPGNAIALAGTYFWTEINRPVSAVLLSTNLYRRENLGQILSQGTELHLDIEPQRAISATLGYQYAHAVVTRYNPPPVTMGTQQNLVGNWIPEVPRQSFTAQLLAARPSLGELILAAHASGHAWDDSANTFLLNAFFELDLSAHRDFGRHWTASLILDNLLNQRADVARTPTLTLGSPFLAEGGLAFHWAAASAH